jgi:lysophospholipid acyltransferase (LPLAT)-like uncharacterized protein
MAAGRESAAGARKAVGWWVAVLGFAAAWFIRLLGATLRRRYHGVEELRRRKAAGERVILAFWHRHILLMPFAYGRGRATVLISLHRDGELVARAIRRLGYEPTRGSTSRGGLAGLRELVRKGRAGYDLAFAPDGPRGPAGEVHPGVLAAAQATGFPILPVAWAASRCRRLASWDRFVVPWPLAAVDFVYGEPLTVPRYADVAPYAAALKGRLDVAEAEAERRASGEGAAESGP